MEPAVHLGHQMQVALHVEGANGEPRTCELWIVEVSGAAYLRALSGVGSWWYRQVTRTAAQLWYDEGVVEARFEPVGDPVLLDRIDAAYEQKYGLGWPGPVGFITAPEARRATLRVITGPST
ncbi:DUF2255 family protein [Streptomyces sp. MA15]|uniref:DUF2255 family protein n=1 Tax=Streptomyces sp. MA15 TaxID=3055061 RepID=UPI0025B00565|nr:DUF2255 family protein [Streptomyces sp. MA15]MDN3270386.1 DUF2255 family protein [Streptomyces sp. MA15]